MYAHSVHCEAEVFHSIVVPLYPTVKLHLICISRSVQVTINYLIKLTMETDTIKSKYTQRFNGLRVKAYALQGFNGLRVEVYALILLH